MSKHPKTHAHSNIYDHIVHKMREMHLSTTTRLHGEDTVAVVGVLVEWRAHAHAHRHTFPLNRAVDEAVGTGSHLQWLAGVINDVALNFGDRHFWEPLFTLH